MRFCESVSRKGAKKQRTQRKIWIDPSYPCYLCAFLFAFGFVHESAQAMNFQLFSSVIFNSMLTFSKFMIAANKYERFGLLMADSLLQTSILTEQ